MEDVLPPKSLWNASILAYGCESDITVTELSKLGHCDHCKSCNSIIHVGTHDIQNVSVSSPLPGQIRITGTFVDGSTATGVLLIIYSLNIDSNAHYIAKHKELESVSVMGNYGFSLILISSLNFWTKFLSRYLM